MQGDAASTESETSTITLRKRRRAHRSGRFLRPRWIRNGTSDSPRLSRGLLGERGWPSDGHPSQERESEGAVVGGSVIRRVLDETSMAFSPARWASFRLSACNCDCGFRVRRPRMQKAEPFNARLTLRVFLALVSSSTEACTHSMIVSGSAPLSSGPCSAAEIGDAGAPGTKLFQSPFETCPACDEGGPSIGGGAITVNR